MANGYSRVDENEWIIVHNTHEPIISQELFDKVQEINNKTAATSRANSGLKQHDMYSWEVARDHLAVAEGFTEGSRFFDATVKNWFAAMPVEQRKELIDGIYSVITSSDAEAVAELRGGKSALTMLKAAAELDEETRHVVFEAFRAFFSSAKKAAGQRRQSKNHTGTDTN